MSDYIPLELISNIFLRLQTADVVRCSSVCKLWYELITSSSFIYLHLKSSISNTQSRVIVRFTTEDDNYLEKYYLHGDNQEFEELQELEPPREPDESLVFYGSSNGVFCCSVVDGVDGRIGHRLILWNPSIGKSLILPKSRNAQLSYHPQRYSVGFGFLPSTINFKVVKVTYTKNSDHKFLVPPEVEIYESYTRSWRDVDTSQFSYVLEFDSSQALLNGIVHWTALNPHRIGGKFSGLIVSFDLTSEKFETLMLPKSAQNLNNMYFFSVHAWKESLWLLHHDSIFVMKEYGITDSWEKFITFNFLQLTPLHIRENGVILAGMEDYDEEFDSLVSWDPKTNEIMDIGVHEDGVCFDRVYAYVDSLFLI